MRNRATSAQPTVMYYTRTLVEHAERKSTRLADNHYIPGNNPETGLPVIQESNLNHVDEDTKVNHFTILSTIPAVIDVFRAENGRSPAVKDLHGVVQNFNTVIVHQAELVVDAVDVGRESGG